jgi:hypothetical protein
MRIVPWISIAAVLAVSGCQPPKPEPPKTGPVLKIEPSRLRPKAQAPIYRLERSRYGGSLRQI